MKPGTAAAASGSLFRSRRERVPILRKSPSVKSGSGSFPVTALRIPLVRIHLTRPALPHPNRVFDGVEGIPRQLSATILKTAALEEPLHHSHRDDNADNLGAQVDEERARRRIDPDEERKPEHERGDGQEARRDERS